MTDTAQVLALISTILILITGLEIRVRSLVKTYLIELKPNSGSSIKDQINRLENRQSEIYEYIKSKKDIDL
jgi:hypothetical protein